MIERMLPVAALTVSYAGLALAAASGAVGWIVVATALVAVTELGVAHRWDRIERTLTKLSFGFARRRFTADTLLIVAAARATGVSASARTTVVIALVAGSLVAAGYLVLRRDDLDLSPVGWRNLSIDRPRWWRSRTQGFRLLSLPVLACVAALLVDRLATDGRPDTAAVIALAIVAVGVPAAVVVALAAHLSDSDRPSGSPDDDLRHALLDAWQSFAPEVVVHFGGPDSSTHVVNVWTPSLAAVEPRAAVIVRERVHLRRVEAAGLPVLYLPRNTDIELFATSSVGVALYPTNIVKNNHLIRVPGIVDVFVGHGDSDKAGSASPITRIYDEVWVAGAAGRERYRRARVGVRDDQIREIGRPQLADIERAADTPRHDRDEVFTVLYAPTWEGFYSAWSYSSLASMGPEIIAQLVRIDGVRVVYKPHPATGSQNPDYAKADRAVRELVLDAGAPHDVMTGVAGLYAAFNTADMLISDVSSVVTDFLYSRKPYVVTNPHGLDHVTFGSQYPSAAGAALLDPGAVDRLPSIIGDARGEDPLAGRRTEVATYLLGPDRTDPLAGFADAVAGALSTARRQRSG